MHFLKIEEIAKKRRKDIQYTSLSLSLHRLIGSSKKKWDRKYLTMKKLTSAFVHPACQAMYNRQSSIDQTNNAKRMRLSDGKETIIEAKKWILMHSVFFADKFVISISMTCVL